MAIATLPVTATVEQNGRNKVITVDNNDGTIQAIHVFGGTFMAPAESIETAVEKLKTLNPNLTIVDNTDKPSSLVGRLITHV